MTNNPFLSIIITSYTMNRLKDILELLESIKTQTYDRIETLVVIDTSRELEEIVSSYIQEKNISNAKVIFNTAESGASAARNLGISKAQGEIIAFVDDDAVLYPDWAEEMVKTYADENVIGVTGLSFPLWQDKKDSWFPDELHWIISCTTWGEWQDKTEVRNIWLQNGSFRKEAFEQAGMISLELGPRDGAQGFKGREFEDGIVSEEVDLSLRVKKATGKQIILNPGVRIQHKVYSDRVSLEYIKKWAHWTGFSKHKAKKLYGQTESNLLGREYNLLKRIFIGLLLTIVVNSFTHPVIAWRKLYVTIIALFYVTQGYFSHLFLDLRKQKA